MKFRIWTSNKLVTLTKTRRRETFVFVGQSSWLAKKFSRKNFVLLPQNFAIWFAKFKRIPIASNFECHFNHHGCSHLLCLDASSCLPNEDSWHFVIFSLFLPPESGVLKFDSRNYQKNPDSEDYSVIITQRFIFKLYWVTATALAEYQ